MSQVEQIAPAMPAVQLIGRILTNAKCQRAPSADFTAQGFQRFTRPGRARALHLARVNAQIRPRRQRQPEHGQAMAGRCTRKLTMVGPAGRDQPEVAGPEQFIYFRCGSKMPEVNGVEGAPKHDGQATHAARYSGLPAARPTHRRSSPTQKSSLLLDFDSSSSCDSRASAWRTMEGENARAASARACR